MKKLTAIIVVGLVLSGLTSCKKFLDKKSNQALSTFRSLSDLQALLDEPYQLYMRFPTACEVAADNITLTDAAFNVMKDVERNRFIWSPDFVFSYPGEWDQLWKVVNVANNVLDNVNKVKQSIGDSIARNTVEGHAYFLRGYALMKGADVWCKAYHPDSAASDLGLPLRLNSDFWEPSRRSTLEETFRQIERDLKRAASLLPDYNINPLRPSKPAAFATLARLYLQMGEFSKSNDYADSCLSIKNDLLDYNTSGAEIRPTQQFPFVRQCREVVFDSGCEGSGEALDRGLVNKELYHSYSDDDLRKSLFFRVENDSTIRFKGSYLSGPHFNGITTSEVFFIRAECRARIGDIDQALDDINHILAHRFKSGTFVPFNSTNQAAVIDFILEHRRKELLFRMLRWPDIKRLNRLGYNIVLSRRVNGVDYMLFPNEDRYAMAIPENVIRLSGMPQNPR